MKTIIADQWNSSQSWFRREVIRDHLDMYRITVERNVYDNQCRQITERYDGTRWYIIDDVDITLMPRKYRELHCSNPRVDVATNGLQCGTGFMRHRLFQFLCGVGDYESSPATVLVRWASMKAECKYTPHVSQTIQHRLDEAIEKAFDFDEE